MKILNSIKLVSLSVLLLMQVSCNVENPIDQEQYKKQIYLVGAHDKIQQKEVAYGGEYEIFITAAVGGTLKLDHDVTVTLEPAHQVNIDNYNKKNVSEEGIKYEAMPQSLYTLPSWTGTIKAGEEYVRIPIRINANSVDSDKRYIIPIKIAEVSDYESNPLDTVLMVNPQMKNDYSGTYLLSGTSIRYINGEPVEGEVSSVNTQRVVMAIDQYTVRLFHKVEAEKLSNADKAAMILSVDPMDNKVTIEAWKDLPILSGGGTYDPVKHQFKIWYHYMENGKEYRLEANAVRND